MQQDLPLKKVLQAISLNHKMEELDQFKDEKKWKTLESEDLTLLANLFVNKGIIDLKKNENDARESFNTALKITRHHPEISYKIVDAWTGIGEWDSAHQILDYLIKNNIDLIQALTEKASLFLIQGSQMRQEEHFSTAIKLFEEAEMAMKPLPPESYYKWGKAHLLNARNSQEPCDFHFACEKFKVAESLGHFDKSLFFDHSMALSELSTYLSRVDLVHESLLYLLKAVETDPHYHEGWLHLGGTYKFLYEQGEKDEYFERAESAFITAARINPNSKFLWMTWGQMLSCEGKTKRNPDVLHQALEKFERVESLHPKDRDIQCFMADTLMLIGLLEDRYELIKEARAKIEEVLILNPDDATILYLHGTCLLHVGKYFGDEKLIKSSFERYEKAIKQNPDDPWVWQSLGIAHYTLGDMIQDPLLLEKASSYFENASKLSKQPHPEILNNWGVALMKLSEVTEDLSPIQIAADKFEQAIAYHQTQKKDSLADPEWFYNYGCALDYLGDYYQDPSYYEKSVQILGHVLTQYPNYTQARYNLGLAMTHLGEATGEPDLIENALHHYEEILRLDPEDEMVLCDLGLALITLGDIYYQSHSFTQGKKYFEEAEIKLLLASQLGAKTAYFWLGCLYSLNSNYPESIHYLEKARDHEVLPALEEIENEAWLEGVRTTTSFKNFMCTLLS